MMSCSTVVERLDAFRTGELGASERDLITAHIVACPACAETLADIKRLAIRVPALRVRAPGNLLEQVMMSTGDHYGVVNTELGPVWVGFNLHGITMVYLGTDEATVFEQMYTRRLGRSPQRSEVPAQYARAVQEAAMGAYTPEVPVSLASLQPFEREVLLLLPRIPRGEVRPYAWLAREAGRPRAVRAVGNALARNPVPFLLPCHRVVPTSGGVGNYGFGSALKRQLLQREGVPVEELDALARRGVRYVGCRSTGIYCFPTCRDVRRVRTENRVPFSTISEAIASGYRPCQHCRPMTSG